MSVRIYHPMDVPYNIDEREYHKIEPDTVDSGTWKPYKADEFGTILHEIGRSTTAKVDLMVHESSGFLGAMKIVPYGPKNRQGEIETLTIARECPFLLRLIDVFTRSESNPEGTAIVQNYYLFMEYAPFKTLDDLTMKVKGIGTEKSKFYIMEIASGVAFLHTKNIMHRDIKPGNVVIRANGHVALGDFGLSVDASCERKVLCGTYLTRAPEMWNNNCYSLPIDAWMCGITLYNIITNLWPFLSPNKEKHKLLVLAAKLPKDKILCPHSSDLLEKLLTVDPNERLAVSKILEHPYVTSLEPPYEPPYTMEELSTALSELITDYQQHIIWQITQDP